MTLISADKEYAVILSELKIRIRNAQIKAVISVNKELLMLYWHIGKKIVEKQNNEGWGAKIIDRLSKDLSDAFPKMRGFSIRNLKYMRKFADEYPDISIVQEVLAQITWYHNITLLDKIKSKEARLWYAMQALQNGWSRNVLVHHIELGLFDRKEKAICNFDNTLPSPHSDLAKQTLKDPYIFDFLSLSEEVMERELEDELTKHITRFILELGSGFSFVGRQYHLEIGKDDFYIDLLFYHLKLRCYFAIELKTGEFKPEYAGKISFYLAAINDLLNHPGDKPAIGLILCKSKNSIVAEYALKSAVNPISVSTYKLTDKLPKGYRKYLPSGREIAKHLKCESEK